VYVYSGGNKRKLALAVAMMVANFILAHLPPDGPDAAIVVMQCRRQNLFLRDAAAMGSQLGSHAVRLAVKDAATNQRMIEIIDQALQSV